MCGDAVCWRSTSGFRHAPLAAPSRCKAVVRWHAYQMVLSQEAANGPRAAVRSITKSNEPRRDWAVGIAAGHAFLRWLRSSPEGTVARRLGVAGVAWHGCRRLGPIASGVDSEHVPGAT